MLDKSAKAILAKAKDPSNYDYPKHLAQCLICGKEVDPDDEDAEHISRKRKTHIFFHGSCARKEAANGSRKDR